MVSADKNIVQFAKRIQSVKPSLTLSIDAKAKQLKQEGVDVLSFSAGEPDCDTPENIKEAAIQSLRNGFTKYTPVGGTLELKKTISEKLKNENSLSYAPDQIVVSCGAKHSLYNVVQVLVDEGDEVIIPSPYWLSYPEMVNLAGGKSVALETDFKDQFTFTPKALEKLITPKTKLLILNSPSNPTGVVYSRELLEEVVRIAKKHSFYIISDEIYEKLIYDAREHISIGALDDEILSRTITVGGASKAYAMTGWRLGFAACPKNVTQASESLQSHSTSNPTSFAQAGYVEALKTGGDEAKKMCGVFQKRRDMIYRLVSGIPKLKPFKPGGAFYLFVDISETKLSSLVFAQRLLEEAKVAVVPGVAFGNDHSIRMSFAASERVIESGVSRIGEWLKNL